MQRVQRGQVYFLVMKTPREPDGAFGLVKIGITSGDVADRVATLQTGNPYDLRCIDSIETAWPGEVEHFMHRAHAPDMQQNEWLRWNPDGLSALVNEAKEAARQIEERKSKEQGYIDQASNGQTRPPASGELRLWMDAQQFLNERVPAQLRLKAAENRIKAATGATLGIPGIVRVKYIPETRRFSGELARSQFPDLISQCCVDTMGGRFQWLLKPRGRCFSTEYQAAQAAAEAARAAVGAVAQGEVNLQGWADRTPDLERRHDDFLQQTRTVHQLDAKLADIQTELTLALCDSEAIERVCRFRRRPAPKIDKSAFYEKLLEEYHEKFTEQRERCKEQRVPQIRKKVYTSRSYL
jgi:hypothetical protein